MDNNKLVRYMSWPDLIGAGIGIALLIALGIAQTLKPILPAYSIYVQGGLTVIFFFTINHMLNSWRERNEYTSTEMVDYTGEKKERKNYGPDKYLFGNASFFLSLLASAVYHYFIFLW